MSKVKKIILVILTILTLILSFSLTAFALNTVSVSSSDPTSAVLRGYDNLGELRVFTSSCGRNSKGTYWVKNTSGETISSLQRIFIHIPISVSVPEGNYWSLGGNLTCSYINSSGTLTSLFISDLIVQYTGSESGYPVIFDYNGSSSKKISFSTDTMSFPSGELRFSFSISADNCTDLSMFYISLLDLSCTYGLESEFQAENEKKYNEDTGKQSLNDVQSAVPDKSAGMLNALSSLQNAVSYSGTSAVWKFPSLYLPAIDGVCSRINLTDEMDVDIGQWVKKIPSDILTVVQSLASIGLVIYAFKELYSMISYVLTLKGGGDSE